jgi:hypothetical protein
MIKEVIGVNILTNKGHQVYKTKTGQLQRLLKLGAHAPRTPLKDHLKRPPIREDLKVLIYQSQKADNTFITSDGTSPYNSTR